MADAAPIEKYGMRWPATMLPHQIELYMWKHWRELPSTAELCNPVEEHLYRALDRLFTKDQLTIHPWFEEQAHSWTYDQFSIWWGCASSGKSHTLGLLTLLDFITDPDCTFALLASTSKGMLALRSYASVVQFLGYLKSNRQFRIPFKFVASAMMVVPENTDDNEIASLRHVIKGVAVQQGTTEEARQNLQGVHTRYVRAIFDELTGMEPAAMESRHNLAQCFDFKLIGACNPESIYDEAGKYSIPKAGWQSVSVDTKHWETPWGTVLRFDAYDSPGIKEPEKYPFLPTQVTIDRIVTGNNGNADAPGVWTFLRAFPPPQASERTILTEAMVKAYNMGEPVQFKDTYIKVAALDPAFTADGDDCELITAKVGISSAGTMTIMFDKEVIIPIKASDPKPVLEQIVEGACKVLDEENIDDFYFGCDDSGNQSVADAIAMKRRNTLLRLNYSEKPPDLPVSVSNPTSAQKKYRNVITWCYYTFREYAERGQIKGLPPKAVEQMCKRRIGTKQQPHMLESKKDHKARLKGRSPDCGDACAMIAGICRLRLGLAPGATEWNPSGAQEPVAYHDQQRITDLNNLTSAYVEDSLQNDVDDRPVI